MNFSGNKSFFFSLDFLLLNNIGIQLQIDEQVMNVTGKKNRIF